jgi:hypothetical protein
MDMRQYAGSMFVTVESLRDGPRQETIAAVGLGKFDRPTAAFKSGNQFSLNKSNTSTLIAAYGPNGQDWVGCTIELHVGTATFNNEERESVVVKPVTPPKPIEARTPSPMQPPKKSDLDDDVPY